MVESRIFRQQVFLKGFLCPAVCFDRTATYCGFFGYVETDKRQTWLDVLKRMQTDDGPNILITDEDFADVAEVDLKLVRLAKKMGGLVVTNDFNLNKVADLHGVSVLNINDLRMR